MDTNKKVWGFLRETTEEAEKAGLDKDTGICRTGLEEYLAVIFPKTTDWIHNKIIDGMMVNGKQSRMKPDYRSDSLKLIVEFDGIPHYKYVGTYAKDIKSTQIYEKNGYRVVRIPYFIQLSKRAVKTLFGVDMHEELFNENISSLGVKGENTPAYLSPEGVKRMAVEFKRFPEQYKVNLDFMKSQNNPTLTGVEYLELFYNSLKK